MQCAARKKKDSTGTTVQGESFFVAQQSNAPISIVLTRPVAFELLEVQTSFVLLNEDLA